MAGAYQCDICGKLYTNKQERTDDINILGKDDKAVTCVVTVLIAKTTYDYLREPEGSEKIDVCYNCQLEATIKATKKWEEE